MARHHRKSPSRICHFVTCFLLIPIIIILLGVSLATDNWILTTVDRDLFSLEQLKTTSDPENYEHSRIAYNRKIGIFRECYLGKFPAFLRSKSGSCHSINYTVPEEKQLTLELWQHLQLKRTQLACMILALFFCSVTFTFAVCCSNPAMAICLAHV
ncbi:uncharacterized protein LOC106869761 [Octopus bimaculoides]|uniref:uncharacterized protein LOC106869761 n=1 Tax=Octopus bimaculoides TaxID=37653 RepID=UPI00071DBED7|nr:uncharacterized protein LOC106869761 [Octopus bimaculoides]|eukprot:XP_014771112.1 PREDICTED: uncharacterized protein LOC106869761 [Octopus bimaculoides]